MYTPLQNLRFKDAFLLISGIEQYFHAGSPEGATAVLGGCAIDALLEPTAPIRHHARVAVCKTISGFAPFKAQSTASWTLLDGDMIARISSPNVFGLAYNESGNPKRADAAASF